LIVWLARLPSLVDFFSGSPFLNILNILLQMRSSELGQRSSYQGDK